MDLTKNYKLKKPSADDFADIGDLNENADAIDAQLKRNADGLAAANSAITSLQTNKADRSELPATLPANGGNADTVNGYNVGCDVPAGAKFTDTKYTHPTTAGNKHIPAGGSSGQILKWAADGTAVWGADNNTTYSAMTGATASAAGKAGLVPAPAAGASTRYLRSDGTWQVPPNTTYAVATTSTSGLMGNTDKSKLNNTMSVTAINQGTISSLSATMGNHYIPNVSRATKVLVEYWSNVIFTIAGDTTSRNLSNYGSRYFTGMSSSMTAVAPASIVSGSLRSVSLGVDETGRPYFTGSTNSNDCYRVTWFL